MNTDKTIKTAQGQSDGYTFLDIGWISIEEDQPKPQQRDMLFVRIINAVVEWFVFKRWLNIYHI